MLKKLNNKTVVSEKFRLETFSTHRDPQIKYTEKYLTVIVDMEGGTTDSGEIVFLIYTNTMKYLTPADENSVLTSAKRQEILKNIDQALDLLEIKHELVE